MSTAKIYWSLNILICWINPIKQHNLINASVFFNGHHLYYFAHKENFSPKFLKYLSWLLNKTVFYEELCISYFFLMLSWNGISKQCIFSKCACPIENLLENFLEAGTCYPWQHGSKLVVSHVPGPSITSLVATVPWQSDVGTLAGLASRGNSYSDLVK